MSNTPSETPDRADASAARAIAILNRLVEHKGGQRRAGQEKMADASARALVTQNPKLIQAGTGTGKALDVDTPIPTLEGWVRMGDLQAGVHHPFDPQTGKPCNITEGFDVLNMRKCFLVTFRGGATLVADGKHLWDTITASALPKLTANPDLDPWTLAETRTTEEIAETLSVRKRSNHRIPMAAPFEAPDADLPIPPYELGLWLGGTERRTTDQTLITATSMGDHEFEAFEPVARGNKINVRPLPETREVLEGLGLLSSDRFIPTVYMFAAEPQRRALFAGLMDAMGQPRRAQRQKVAQVQAYKTQVQLMEDTHSLACSLGIRATIGDRKFSSEQYRHLRFRQIRFTPDQQVFRAPAKIALAGDFDDEEARRLVSHRSIVSIEPVPSRPVRCISVDSPSRLYMAGRDFIPTHNSLAYIAGALASEEKVAVAPHTKALQDQLGADLDLVIDAFADADFDDVDVPLNHAPKYAILKGRSAYFCGNRAYGDSLGPAPEGEQATLPVDSSGDATSPSSDLGKEVAELMEWAKTTESGDRSDAPPVSSAAWAMVCGSADDCSANACAKNPDRCFAQRAHELAKEADIVVINQSLLAAGMKIEQVELGGATAVIIDEAHELPSVIAGTFGAILRRRRVEQVVARGANMLLNASLIDSDEAETYRKDVDQRLSTLERDLSKMHKWDADRQIAESDPIKKDLNSLIDLVQPLSRKARAAADRAADDQEKGKRQAASRALENLVEDLRLLTDGSTDTQVTWADKENGKPVLHAAQFDVSATIYRELISRIAKGKVVMTSATLTVGGSFDHPAEQMGFTLAADEYPWTGEIVESPFDYKKQGMLWLPEDMPAPPRGNDPKGKAAYTDAVADVAIEVAKAAGGRTLVLCTSRSSVEAVAERLQDALTPEGIEVLVQRSGEPTHTLAKRFGEEPRTVLVGTRTFWTGVSINGDACVAVVVDKIPFPTPSDPIIAARTEQLDAREGKGAGFRKVSLAEAILTIVQGVGRLIRTVDDRGVVVLADPRLNPRTPHAKRYWRSIADSLPEFTRTIDQEKTLEFLREIDRTANDANLSAEVEEVAESPAEAGGAVAA